MNNIIKRVWNQNKMVNIEALQGMTFQAESGGHTFQISGVDDTGAAVPLSGTVAGVFMRPDHADIALAGSASDGVVSVTLTDDCYAIPGRFGLTIFVTSGGQKTAVYAAVGTVAVTSGGGVAGDTPQDVVDLINAIEAAVATIPASYTDLMAAIAPMYSNSALYAIGSYAWYEGDLYRCTTPITTAETWTAAHWLQVVLSDDIEDLKSEVSTKISRNLLGDTEALYPVYLPAGTSICVSTADGTTFKQNNYRVYCYDADGTFIDWFGLYPSYGSSRVITFNQDVYYLSWQTGNIPSNPNLMVNVGKTKSGYVPYYTVPSDFIIKGFASSDLKSYRENGIYFINPASYPSIIDKPENLAGNVTATLLVYGRAFNAQVLQVLITTKGETFLRAVTSTGTSATAWKRIANSEDLSCLEDIYNQSVFSLSGNYYKFDEASMNSGLYNSVTGSVTEDVNYKYAIVPLHGPGTYVKTGLFGTFGNNITYYALLDANKNFVTSVAGVPAEEDTSGRYSSKLEITEGMAEWAKYTVLHYAVNYPYIPKLFYNSDTIDLSEYENATPKYGFSTDPLYRKILVCDGDSICAGVTDLPKQTGAYYGRFKLCYQMSGKNYAVGGGTICDKTNTTVGGNPRHSVALNIDTIHSEYEDLDYLILEGGTNDADLIGPFDGDTPPAGFGTWSESDFSGNYDTTTFCGGVEYLFYKALTYYPHAKIGFIIAMEMGTSFSNAVNRKRYFDEIVKIAKKWHIPVLNLWETSTADARLKSFYDSTKTPSENVSLGSFYYDGQHPTSAGYDKMQPMIEAWIKGL